MTEQRPQDRRPGHPRTATGKQKLKNFLRPAYERALTCWIGLTEPPRGAYPIVIQGIQRSGTNHLTALLERSDYRILNKIDPKRDDPRHKHFRWQDDKATIVMDERYLNARHVSSMDEINLICGYPSDTKHLVLFRSPEEWLNSIYRWGLRNGWFPTEEAFFDQGLHEAYLREWDAYYTFWQERFRQDPARVLLLSHEVLTRDPAAGLERIDTFMGVSRPAGGKPARPVEKVRHSRPISEKRQSLQRAELEAALARRMEFDWKSLQRGGS